MTEDLRETCNFLLDNEILFAFGYQRDTWAGLTGTLTRFDSAGPRLCEPQRADIHNGLVDFKHVRDGWVLRVPDPRSVRERELIRSFGCHLAHT